jgi:hypothetical protein
MVAIDIEKALAADISTFYDDPLGFVLYAFPWGKVGTPLEDYKAPRKWQVKFLTRLGEEIRQRKFNGKDPVEPIRMAVVSGHGVGKSALSAWLNLFIMSTRPRCRGIVTANTSDQLKTKTWAELSKWHNLVINKHWFEYSSGKGSMSLRCVMALNEWRVDAQTCREENSESFAGLHAANSTPYYLFDEASAVPDIIHEVAQGGLTDGEPMIFLFGNPTRNSGKFRETWRKERHRWIVFHVDARNVEGTNKQLIQEWIDDYGEDSDFVRVRVKGEAPRQSIAQFISDADIDQAICRELKPAQYRFAPVIIGVDPAWTGKDEIVIAMRQGLYSRILYTAQKNDNDFELATVIARFEDDLEAQAVNIDLGYGTGIVSAGKVMGRKWNLVSFASTEGIDQGCANKRASMIKDVRDWLKQGGSIEDDKALIEELRVIETVHRLDGKILIESKQSIQKRIGKSTNRLDALALTFAVRIAPKGERAAKVSVVNNFTPY